MISCLDDNPKKRPSVAQVLLDIKTAKNAYLQKSFVTMWSTELPAKQQMVTQVQDQQANFQQQEQEQQDPPRLLERKQVTQLQKRGQEHDNHEQQRPSEFQKLDVKQLPQVSYIDYIYACI